MPLSKGLASLTRKWGSWCACGTFSGPNGDGDRSARGHDFDGLRMGLFVLRTWLAALLLALVGLVPGTARALDLSNAVFRVFASFDDFTSTGTSFAINADGIFVTNYHVVFDQANNNAVPDVIEIGYLDERGRAQFARADVLWSDERNDLAVLSADLPVSVRALVLVQSAESAIGGVPEIPEAGKDVLAVGFPGVADTYTDDRGTPPELLIATVTSGVVGRVYRFSLRGGTFGRAVVQHNAEINRGNSGGPLLDRCDRVIGVNTLKPVATFDLETASPQDRRIFNQTPDGVFWATHTNTVVELLENSGTEIAVETGPCVQEPQVVERRIVERVVEGMADNSVLWIAIAAVGVLVVSLFGFILWRRSGDGEKRRALVSQLVREKLGQGSAAPASPMPPWVNPMLGRPNRSPEEVPEAAAPQPAPAVAEPPPDAADRGASPAAPVASAPEPVRPRPVSDPPPEMPRTERIQPVPLPETPPPPAAMAAQLRLMGETEVNLSARWLLEQADGALTVGRSPDESDLVLESLAVSRIHARISYRDGAFWVEDAGSSNGTKIGGRRISGAHQLEDGDEVTFGDKSFRVEVM